MKKFKDLTGQKFGKLTVLGFHHIEKYHRKDRDEYQNIYYWLCKCECGNKKVMQVKKKTQSCGCESRKNLLKSHIYNGLSNTKLYNIWQGMKSRCYRKKASNYKLYGNRGIKICDEWLNNFMNFYGWALNNGYSDDLTIDRIDVNGNYEPSNCRWTTVKEQSRNRRNNNELTYNNETHCIAEWVELLGISKDILYKKSKTNMNDQEIIEYALSKKEQK